METRVAVVGGGYAGMAAALTIAEAGIPVTVFESSKVLGGRARGIAYKGMILDNGQHILLGCYSQTLSLIEKACKAQNPFSRMPLELNIDAFRLKAFPLPSPFDLLLGLLFSRGLTMAAKLGAIRFLYKTKSLALDNDMTAAALLESYGQQEGAINCLWAPLCVSALNTPISRASAKVFLSVLRDGLNGRGSDIIVPNVDLSSLFPNGAAELIIKAGGGILTSNPVKSLARQGDEFELVTDRDNFSFSHVILAVAPQHVKNLTKEFPEVDIPDFAYQPIVTVYSRYPDNVRLPVKMIGSSRGFSQWLFDRGQGLIAAVISAEGIHTELTQAELAGAIHEETKTIIPDLPEPVWQRVIHEKRATFSCDVDVPRPEQKTAVPNLYLAGDYTAGDYPATLEGAVLSGLACAREIIKTI